MPYNPNEPQNGEIVDADFLRDQFNALKTLTDQKLSTETDPVFAGSEAALFQPGDKAKLDSLGGGGGSYSSRNVAFDTVYTPSATKDVIVIARVALTSSGGDAVSLVAWSDNQADPATEVGR